ncbi:NifU family protein [Actinomadura sp. GC306]|uniref:NifU family protein n=1 Tax=Actinomadura sp. GC306 TaxID=2530367 RepID=UPI00104D2611|nr:NifU family protein [Actinomadura sp. GC306]TDC62885.1 NifU family protein [Actinomadura sp. GC306]
MSEGPRARLDEGAVADRLARLDETLGRLEQTPGATAETALDAVTMLTEVYGEALARVMEHIPAAAAESLVADDLVGHLLVLHDVHPEPVERRVARTLDGLRPRLGRQGIEADLVGIEAGTARVGLKGGGCGGTEPAAELVREALLAAAPELAGVELVAPKAPPAFVPVDALLRPPATAADGAA